MKKVHVLTIVLGAILMLAGAFHNNVWFDETYTVNIINQSFIDIIQIGIADVHPLLYYIVLKLFCSICGTSIIVLRIFSVLGIITLSILGYTHIKKDFGERIGFLFSALTITLPTMLMYSNEIRMYSWAAVLVTLTAIYAYRITKESTNKNWILFALFSVLSAYTHYYATMAIGVINVVLFVYIIRKHKELIKRFITFGVIQFILFLPGLYILIIQTIRVASGFWINIQYPQIFAEIIRFPFAGKITNLVLVGIVVTLVYAYLIYNVVVYRKENKETIRLAGISLLIYLIVIALALILSIKTAIFTSRYTIPITGLLIFFIASILSLNKRKFIDFIVIGVILSLAIYSTVIFYNANYSTENGKLVNEISAELNEDDVFIYTNIMTGSIVATYFPDNQQYFYNINKWSIEQAYKAFSPQMKCINDLSEVDLSNKRVWVIDGDTQELYDLLKEDVTTVIETKEYYMPYSKTAFKICAVEFIEQQRTFFNVKRLKFTSKSASVVRAPNFVRNLCAFVGA